MAETVFSVVILEGLIQGFLTHLIGKQSEGQGWYVVGRKAIINRRGDRFNRSGDGGQPFSVGQIQHDQAIEVNIAKDICIMVFPHVAVFIVTIQAFILPGMGPFIGSQNPIKPIVTNFVGDHIIQAGAGHVGLDEGKHGVFHPPGKTFYALYSADLGPGIRSYKFVVK